MDISNSQLAGLPKSRREMLAAHKAEQEAKNAAFLAAENDAESELQ
jgi:hypothetical protein